MGGLGVNFDHNGMPLGEAKARTVEQAVADCYAGYAASAGKRGRNPRWPFVPIIKRPSPRFGVATEQVRGKAFETREQAVAYAQKTIDFWADRFRAQLTDPQMRAIRAQWGIADPDHPMCAAMARIDGPIEARVA